jgi:serine/threonine-protein kinase TTK/MPS1
MILKVQTSMSTSYLAPTSISFSNPRAASTRLVSSSFPRVPPARAAYLSNGASTASDRLLTDIQRGSRSRQIMPGPNRAGRIMKSTSAPKYNGSAVLPSFDRISERETSDSEQAEYYSPVRITVNGDCTDLEDEPVVVVDPAAVPLPCGPHVSGGRKRGLSAGSTAARIFTIWKPTKAVREFE